MKGGCWTCRDRKIRCDQKQPICSNCHQSSRTCLGRGLRLAWPKSSDKRRAMVFSPPYQHTGFRYNPNGPSLNIDFEDLGLYYELQSTKSTVEMQPSFDRETTLKHENARLRSLPPSQPISWNLVDDKGRAPLSHFIAAGQNFFYTSQGAVLSPLVLKIAMSETDMSSKAVLHAILALSCSHMGRNTEAFAYRASAVSLLSSSLNPGSTVKTAFRNITTSMLLSIFEIYHVSETSANWALYLCGVKKIIADALILTAVHDKECIVIKDWISFHEVLARFSLVHWIKEPEKYPICYETVSNKICTTAEDSQRDVICSLGYRRDTFECISGLTDLLRPFMVSPAAVYERQQQTREIESRLSIVSYRERIRDVRWNDSMQSVDKIAYLYHLAARIYLNKTALRYSGPEIQHQRLVEEAVSHLARIQLRQVPWPLFIIGSEARDEAQRRKILDLYNNQEGQRRPNVAIGGVMRLLKSVWNLHDLDSDEELGYVDRMSGVISASPFLPVFA